MLPLDAKDQTTVITDPCILFISMAKDEKAGSFEGSFCRREGIEMQETLKEVPNVTYPLSGRAISTSIWGEGVALELPGWRVVHTLENPTWLYHYSEDLHPSVFLESPRKCSGGWGEGGKKQGCTSSCVPSINITVDCRLSGNLWSGPSESER